MRPKTDERGLGVGGCLFMSRTHPSRRHLAQAMTFEEFADGTVVALLKIKEERQQSVGPAFSNKSHYEFVK